MLDRSTRLSDVAEAWLQDISKRAKPKTITGYRSNLNSKILSILGRKLVVPYLGSLVTGVGPGAVAGQVAMGVRPAAEPARDPSARCAGVQFIYPERDLVFEDVEVDDALVDASWCESVRILGQLGMEARLPPRGFLARLACAVVVADTPAMLTERLNAAARGVRPVGSSL